MLTTLKTIKDVQHDLHALVAGIHAAVAIVDGAGRIEIVNGELGKLLGRDSRSLCGTRITHILTSPSPGQLVERLRQATAIAAEPWNETLTAETANGPLALHAKFSVIQPSAQQTNVLVVLHPSIPSEAGVERASPAPQQSTPAEMREMVASRSGAFAAGHLEMIGLEEVRASLGARWEKLAERVYGIAESILRTRLTKQDVFRRDADGNYLICFAQLCNEQAWFKAKAISQEIRGALIGDAADDPLAEFRLDAQTRERLSEVKSATYEIRADADELEDVPDVAVLVKEKIAHASAQLKQRAATMLRTLAEDCGTRFLSVRSIDGAAVPMRVADFDTASGHTAEQLRSVYRDSPKLLAQLDTLLLGATVERLYSMDTRQIPMVVVPVHFSTLVTSATAGTYYDVCNSAVGKAAESLVFKVRGIPEDLHHARITDVLRLLRNRSRFTAIQLTRPSLGNIILLEAKVAVAAIDYLDLKGMLHRHKQTTEKLLGQLRQYNVRLAISRVPDESALPMVRQVRPHFYSCSPGGLK